MGSNANVSYTCGQKAYIFSQSTSKCKGKVKCIYIAPHNQGTQAWITQCYLQLYQCLPLPRKHSPDGVSPD